MTRLAPTSINPTSLNGNTPVQDSSWLRETVKEFFSAINWEDQPLAVQELKLAAQQSGAELTLTLTVNQFFKAIAWDGKPIAAPITLIADRQEEASSSSKDTTLDDFSDWF